LRYIPSSRHDFLEPGEILKQILIRGFLEIFAQFFSGEVCTRA